MARVCMFVFNSVARDARVLKEANSLNGIGHSVTIIGLADNNFPDERARLKTGVEILRVPRPIPDRRSGGAWINQNIDVFVVAFLLTLWVNSVYLNVIDPIELLRFLFGPTAIIYLSWRLRSVLSRWPMAMLYSMGRVALRGLGESRWNAVYQPIIGRVQDAFPGLFVVLMKHRTKQRILAMVRLAQGLSPDIVHCHDVHTLPAGAAMKKLTGCFVVYDAHEIYEEVAQSNPGAQLRYRTMHREYLPSIDGFVTINESIAGWYKENYPGIPEPVIVMNATVRAPHFDYDGRLHKEADLPAVQKILLYQGGYASKRGLEYLVRSAAFLPAEWTLVMMGWGRLEPTLQSIADEIYSVEARKPSVPAVRFLPPVPQSELAYWSAGATIGVIPYENVGLNHWFCTPNKLWEYPNAGVPLLVSPFPELRKPIEQYGHGWLLPEDQEPRKLAEQVAGLDDKEIARARKACATFSDAEEWSKYEARLLMLYESLVGAPVVPTAPSATAVAETKSGGQKQLAPVKRA